MPDNDKLFHAGHRERLRQKFLDKQLADYEKLELLLTYSIPRRDVRPLARALVKYFGGVYHVFTAPIQDLLNFPGLGRSSAILIKLNQELMSLSYIKKLSQDKVFLNPNALIEHIRMEMSGLPNEELRVYYLGQNYTVLDNEVHAKGTVDEAPVYPREIMKRALNLNAASIILAHNHPTTDNTFSVNDVVMTENLIKIARVNGLDVYDHFVVSGGIVHSIKAEGLLGNPKLFDK